MKKSCSYIDISRHKTTTDLRNQPVYVRYYQAVQRVISEFQPDQIYHLAAQSYPTVSWTHPQATMETNVNGTINVYEAVKFVRQTRPDYDPRGTTQMLFRKKQNRCQRLYRKSTP